MKDKIIDFIENYEIEGLSNSKKIDFQIYKKVLLRDLVKMINVSQD